ncbi:hypothetical protein OGAPHI_006778 [Ogataea philodendri]|uniref:Signal recognition particle SEC65 subunit n=1 Tax=Ogataea philodendri TaxID=1378263 RepID=A0A9P8T171_9ASCO|nr:uncharacterized protein OGAPHI_006778 [Ogataea philodendri]KAH3661371.1 hypothetical protein OGAPHI_006778 [Ogataea philodendri]
MPKLEEIEDIEDVDNLDMDLAEFDPDLRTPIAPARPKPSVVRSQDAEPGFGGLPQLNVETGDFAKQTRSQEQLSEEELAELRSMQVIYPCYFDKNRSVGEGRRVGVEHSVENPLAKTILDACRHLNLTAVLEPEKTHPQDFGNPGRVRVGLKFKGKQANSVVKNKRQLLLKVAEYLKSHPTTLASVKQLPGPPELMNGYTPVEVSRVKKFKMNTIVPLHSALTMKNPQTESAYVKTPQTPAAAAPKIAKQKVQRIRA